MQAKDLLDSFFAFKSFDRQGLRAQLSFSHGRDLPPETLDWAFKLCKQNMQAGARSDPPPISQNLLWSA